MEAPYCVLLGMVLFGMDIILGEMLVGKGDILV